MGMSLNRVQLIGNLTRDVEVKQIPGGQTVATFGVATNFSWKDQSGEKKDKTEFHNIVAWGKLAEICGQYLKKGGKVFVEGRLQTRDWEAEDGTKRYRTEIVAENMIMLDRKGDAAPGGTYSSSSDRSAAGIKAGGASEPQSDDFPEEEDSGKTKKVKAVVGAEVGVGVSAGVAAKEEVSVDDLPF